MHRHHRADRRPGRTARAPLPVGPVATDTGTVELSTDRSHPSSVTVLVNGVPSSHLDLDDPTYLEFEYMQHMAVLVDALAPGPLDAVHLGAAACTFPRWVEATRPGSRQLAVDVDARLLALVREWFALPRSPALRLRAGEAREVLSRLPAASADLVVRDVFAHDSTPEHLTTREFVEEVARVLRPGGLYLANCADRPPLALVREELATAGSVMDVVLVAEPGQLKGRRYGNLVVGATVRPQVPHGAGHGRPTDGSDALATQPPRDGARPALDGAATARALRTLAVPATLLAGDALRAFVGRARVRLDPPAPEPTARGPQHPDGVTC
ncbi:spermidine synthase [Cellulomonas carbonis]|uniref:Spermidine synthase n=1 Tax=Cellulomonas carbonis T26 TaxID=947969 RepID=A0A0A0BUN4_9CELL|nr:fused MFS/spermidine synthase [Cellulomonas carbonis]KGM12118.1 spermidine synthase [Cellulomonas carbonis T26]GGB97161.1 hypothetical protein GCM10010972_07400 [Cellulomonas carbonis]